MDSHPEKSKEDGRYVLEHFNKSAEVQYERR